MKGYNKEQDNNTNIETFQIRQQLITKLKNRFSTYGYEQISTPTFEAYDLYANMNGTVNHDEMIKTIDNTGKVLVLRPDITIPITQQIAAKNSRLSQELRCFYVLDVFRQSSNQVGNRESTQAGIELFGNNSPEVDAEVIALAIHTLKDLGINHFKIELGHAGFFKELVKELNLLPQDLDLLKQMIQAKNVTEIEPFLERLSVDKKLSKAVQTIPLLYGNPQDVINHAREITFNKKMDEKLSNLIDIYEVLQAYEMDQHIVIDLGLINHMDYYSDIIFQGFTEHVGKPILMGGRYDQLANHFNATIPAIGFACDIDSLLEGMKKPVKKTLSSIDIIIHYEKNKQKDALLIASELRELNYRILTFSQNKKGNQTSNSLYTINMKKGKNSLSTNNDEYLFKNINELLQLLQKVEENLN